MPKAEREAFDEMMVAEGKVLPSAQGDRGVDDDLYRSAAEKFVAGKIGMKSPGLVEPSDLAKKTAEDAVKESRGSKTKKRRSKQ